MKKTLVASSNYVKNYTIHNKAKKEQVRVNVKDSKMLYI